MRLIALVMMVLGLMASGSAKAAGTQKVCGMVVEIAANAELVAVVVNATEGKRQLSTLDNRASGTAAASRLAANTNIVNIATAAMNNPGSLDFCATVNEKNQIVSASAVNRFKK